MMSSRAPKGNYNTRGPTTGVLKGRKKKALALGLFTIGVPFLFKIFTIYKFLSPGGQGELRDVFFNAIVALNFLCLLCLGIIWSADIRDVVVENRIRKLKLPNSKLSKDIKKKDLKKQAKAKWIALVASIINTLTSIAIAAILYTQETTIFNLLMIVFSVITIIFDVVSLYSIFRFYYGHEELKEGNPKLEKFLIKKFNRKIRFKAPPLAPGAQAVLGVSQAVHM